MEQIVALLEPVNIGVWAIAGMQVFVIGLVLFSSKK